MHRVEYAECLHGNECTEVSTQNLLEGQVQEDQAEIFVLHIL
jgi:hypothetical protein